MTELYVLVEGSTEEHFVKSLLAPHLNELEVYTTAIIVQTSRDPGGRKFKAGGRWAHWHKDLVRLTKQHTRAGVHFTTMFDLYGLPSDFPGLEKHRDLADTVARADRLEQSMAITVDVRVIPYLQRHEFEALVFAGLDVLESLLDGEDRSRLRSVAEEVVGVPPEDVNDGASSAPSKRLGRIESYRKNLHGPLVTEAVGLQKLRASCPRFHRWLSRLEQLAPNPPL